MRTRSIGKSLVAVLALLFAMGAAQAAPSKADVGHAHAKTVWIHPVIAKFGGVHPRPDVDMQPDPKADYKIFVDVLGTSDNPARMYHSLGRLARLVNLMGYAKVPAGHVHIVALLDEKAALAALKDASYARLAARFYPGHAKKVTRNPNLPVLHALKKAGVKLMICSQAMAGMGLKDDEIDPSVTITLSGLTDPVIYGHRGYTFMRL